MPLMLFLQLKTTQEKLPTNPCLLSVQYGTGLSHNSLKEACHTHKHCCRAGILYLQPASNFSSFNFNRGFESARAARDFKKPGSQKHSSATMVIHCIIHSSPTPHNTGQGESIYFSATLILSTGRHQQVPILKSSLSTRTRQSDQNESRMQIRINKIKNKSILKII